MLEDNKAILDRSVNPKLLVLNAKEFLDIIVQIYGEGSSDGYEKTLQAIKKEAKVLHKELTKDNILTEFKDAFQDHAFEELAKICFNIIFDKVLKIC
jgi:effector-binding domain-containing protein